MKPLLLALALPLFAAAAQAAQPALTKSNAAPITLAQGGIGKAVIVVTPNSSAPVRHAAEELADFLGQVTGGKFKTVSALQAGSTNICVGQGAAKLADAKFSTAGLDADGMVIRTTGRNLILAGGETRGTLYAVYSFLEDTVGCHWWSAQASTIPKKPTLTIGRLDRRYVPQFEHREILIAPNTNDPDWSVRNKCVGELTGYGHFDIMPERGGVRKQHPPGHDYFYVMPPAKYFAQHPDWYSLIEGKRQSINLELTSPGLQAEFKKNLLTEIRNAPAFYAAAAPQYAGWIKKTPHPFTFTSVTPPDDSGYPDRSQSPESLAIEKAEGSPSGLTLRFVNQMAKAVKAEFPELLVTCFAYHYNQKPPKITRPDPNVVVYYCPIHASFAKPLTDPRNKQFLDDYEGWLKISKRVYFYDYPDNCVYEQVPHPNLYVVAANIKWSAQHGVKGYFGDGINAKSGGSEMAELRAWMIAKLLWDSSQDPHALIKEFTDGYYGAGGKHVAAYIDLMTRALDENGDWLDLGSPANARFLSFDNLAKGYAELKLAETAVKDNPTLLNRIKIAELPVKYVFLVRWNELRYEASTREESWPLAATQAEAYADFKAVMQANGILPSYSTGVELAKIEKAG